MMGVPSKTHLQFLSLTTKIMKITYGDLIGSIFDGSLDADLSNIVDAIRSRQSDIKDKAASVLRFSLKIGDTVILNDTCNPAYIRGEKAIVRKFRTKKIVIDLLRPCGKFHKGIGCPLSIVSKA
jgi:hypothetical protein